MHACMAQSWGRSFNCRVTLSVVWQMPTVPGSQRACTHARHAPQAATTSAPPGRRPPPPCPCCGPGTARTAPLSGPGPPRPPPGPAHGSWHTIRVRVMPLLQPMHSAHCAAMQSGPGPPRMRPAHAQCPLKLTQMLPTCMMFAGAFSAHAGPSATRPRSAATLHGLP